ncbi:hypothetical protein [Acidocella aromatica]|uniref:DUF2029 domain-containing protein n=1 Tax=Acidocella aromatica TaxID=1303579 RepID=A0A840VK41_9PROT|nr:hypothetical protein [Acidocella aromatica]MBB5372619.1 hypothetical protein [Acidocella aromatica]
MARCTGHGIRHELALRCAPSLVAAALYGLFMLLFFAAPRGYAALLGLLDPIPNLYTFTDLMAVLQAGACWKAGVNVYLPSPCMHGGVYNYAPMLLRIADLGIGPALRMPLGLASGVLFLLVSLGLPPARGWGGVVWRCLGLCSGDVMLALNTANLDVLIFVLLVAGLLLLLRARLAALGYALFTLAAAMKLYPAVLLGLVLRERRRFIVLMTLVLAAAGGVYLWAYGAGTARAIDILPGGLPFRAVFGAMNVPFGLALLAFLPVHTLEPDQAAFFAALSYPFVPLYIVVAQKLLVLAGIVSALQLAPRYQEELRGLSESEHLFLLAGAILVGFCFCAAQNLDYRAIFLLLTLPGLMRLRAAEAADLRFLPVAVLLLLWEGLFRHLAGMVGYAAQVLAWGVREYLWWWVVVRLLALCVCWLRTLRQPSEVAC